MKALIMAGGRGTRLRPLTSEQPKPMVRVANVPCMEYIVRLLRSHGVREIVVTLQFMPQEIRDYFGDGSEFGVEIRYSVEDEPAGTAGSVKLAEDELDLKPGESFIVVSGDALTDLDLGEVFRYHESRNSAATVVLKSVENPLDFGIVITQRDGRVSRFLEKPAWGQVFSDTVNTGIYVLDSSVLDSIPDPRVSGEYDFSKQLFPRMLEAGTPVYGYVTNSYWQDIGDLDQYASAHRDVLSGSVCGIRPPGTRLRENVYVESRAQVDDESLVGPVVIGAGARIADAASVGAFSVIGENVVVADGARVERSVIADGTYIGEGAEVLDAIVGRACYVQARVRILERSALGDDVIIGEGATVAPDVKVYPHKTVEDGATVSQSLVYETMGLRTVFRGGRVVGKFNVNFTPEFVVRLASAFGKMLESGSFVTVGRDGSPAARISKQALTAALLAAGINVRDLRAAHAGLVRHDVRSGKSSAGAHIRAGDYPDDVEILFFNSDATPLSAPEEREIEKHLVREEFRRAHGGDVGEAIYPGRVLEQYIERLERALEGARTLPTRAVVVDFSNGVAGLIANQVFARVGMNVIVVSDPSSAPVEDRLRKVGRIVSTSGASFGCVVGPSGEDVRFVDGDSVPVPPDVMVACVLELLKPKNAVVPVNLSSVYRGIVESSGGTVTESRAGLVNVALASASRKADIGVLDDGRLVFPDFLPASDCFVTIAKVLSLLGDDDLSEARRHFSSPVGEVEHERIYCPWAARGRVMRKLSGEFGSDPDAVVSDGVKLSASDGWVFLLPDPDSPVFHVYSEITGTSVAEIPDENGNDVAHYVSLAGSLVRGAAW